MRDMNSVCLMGRLTRDPELRSLNSGTSVTTLRLAFSTSKKDPHSGEWGDKSNYIDVTIFGRSAESAAQHLYKGRPVAVQGRLEWREWETREGAKRQTIEIVCDHWQFAGGEQRQQGSGYASDIPNDSEGFGVPAADPAPAPAQAQQGFGVPGGGAPDDSEIPF